MRDQAWLRVAAMAVMLGNASTLRADDTVIVVESGVLLADDLQVHVHLETGVEVSGTINDLVLPAGVSLARPNGRPDCRPDPEVRKGGSQFAFQPSGCVAGETCTAVRALILSLDNVDPIPSGSRLYSCALPADTPPGRYRFGCENADGSDPAGEPVAVACAGGEIEIVASTVLRAGFSRAPAGAAVAVDVGIVSNEAAVRATAELDFSPFLARGGGAPACVSRVAGATAAFAYRPDGCDPGRDCTGVRAEIAAPAPFATGETLFTCGVDLAADAVTGPHPVRLTAVDGTTAAGAAAHVSPRDGTVYVTGPPPATPTAVPTPAPARSTLEVGSARGAPGETVAVAVTLRTDEIIGGMQNDLGFAPLAAVAVDDSGRPRCTAHPSVAWLGGAEFNFRPPACVPGVDCDTVRALLISAEPGDAVADGTVVYTCEVVIDTLAGGAYPLTCFNHLGSTPDGQELPIGCSAGRIEVVAATATPSVTAVPTATSTGGSNAQSGGSGSSGCAVSEPAGSGWWWLGGLLPLIPALRSARVQRP